MENQYKREKNKLCKRYKKGKEPFLKFLKSIKKE